MRPDVAHGLRDLLAQITTPLVAALDALVMAQTAEADALDALQQKHKRTRG